MPNSGLPLSISRLLKILPLFVFTVLSIPAGARKPNLSKYPLRVHVLASDETHQTPRMSPAQSVVCDAIDGMLSSVSPNPGGPITISGVSGDPCSLHPEMVTGRLANCFFDVGPGDGGQPGMIRDRPPPARRRAPRRAETAGTDPPR